MAPSLATHLASPTGRKFSIPLAPSTSVVQPIPNGMLMPMLAQAESPAASVTAARAPAVRLIIILSPSRSAHGCARRSCGALAGRARRDLTGVLEEDVAGVAADFEVHLLLTGIDGEVQVFVQHAVAETIGPRLLVVGAEGGTELVDLQEAAHH